MKKILKKEVIIAFIVGIILASSIAVYAAINSKDVNYKDGKTVEYALNDLYSKANNSEKVNIEKIWSASTQNIDYTYTANTAGIYLVGLATSNNPGTRGTITTDGNILLEKALGTENVAYGRTADIKLLNINENDKIVLNGYNQLNNASAFIYKISNINLSSIVNSNISIDDTAILNYTATNNSEKVLAVGIGFGRNRTCSISYTGEYLSQDRKENDICIGYANLNKNAKVTISCYGYEYGGGVVLLFK